MSSLPTQPDRSISEPLATENTVTEHPVAGRSVSEPSKTPKYGDQLYIDEKKETLDDMEKGDVGSNNKVDSEEVEEKGFYAKHRPWFHMAYFLIFTGFLIAAYVLQVPKGYSQENLVLGLLWAFTSLKLLFYYVDHHLLTRPVANAWIAVVYNPWMKLSSMVRHIVGTLIVVIVILLTVLVSPENLAMGSTRPQRLISLFGMVVFLAILYASSVNRKAIPWRTVLSGILLQFLLALFVLRTQVGYDIFNWLAGFADTYLGFSSAGFVFLFGDVAGSFVSNVLPAVLFFCSTVQVLYYLGALQWLVLKIATFFFVVMGTSGAESVVAAASPFVGQGESALLIKPFVQYMTNAELHQIMTSGFATISGSTLYGYFSLGVSLQSLLTAAIMSIPCSLAISKLRYPETEESMTKGKVVIPPREEEEANLLHAAGNGAAIGLTIIGLIGASLLAIISLLAAFNGFLTWLGNFLNIQQLTIQVILGYIFVPVAWLMGVPNQDVILVGRLLAEKIIVNEFAAYTDFTAKGGPYLALAERSKVIATYALAGFANLGSVGIQIGVLGTMAPERRGDIARVAISAMLCGALSTCFSASIAGMLL